MLLQSDLQQLFLLIGMGFSAGPAGGAINQPIGGEPEVADRKGEKKRERISVRSLVEFLLRSGDLDNRGGGWADNEAMHRGAGYTGSFRSAWGAVIRRRYLCALKKNMRILS